MLSRRDNSCLFPPKLLYCFSQKTDRKGAVITLETAFNEVYTKFKLHFYQNVFQRFATREATLTTVESFCMEGIMAMGEPTIAEFSRMMQISTPNAAYKIGSLVKKGYVEKIQSMLEAHQVQLLKDIAMLDKMYELNMAYFKELSMYILAGKKKLEQVRAGELQTAMDKAKASGLPEDAQAARDLADQCEHVFFFPLYTGFVPPKKKNITVVLDKPTEITGTDKVTGLRAGDDFYSVKAAFVFRASDPLNSFLPGLEIRGRSIYVDDQAQTNIEGVFAGGD